MSRPKISSTPSHTEVQAVFKRYAMLYARMERLQHPRIAVVETERLLPTGDQKTGCIGEYWAMRYARSRWPRKTCVFGSHSEHGWDIHVRASTLRIQVKTVSAWSNSKTTTPIHHPDLKPKKPRKDWKGWSDLWLIYLDTNLYPAGFWRLKAKDLPFDNDKTPIKVRIPDPLSSKSGSNRVKWPKNEVDKLLTA